MIEYYLIILLVALGTYLTRSLPLSFGNRFQKIEGIEEFLTLSSTALLSALFVTSFISFPINLKNVGVGSLTLVFVFFSYKYWENLGISVIIGVIVHLSISLTISFF